MEKLLGEIIEKNRYLINQGEVASYIPALEKINPNYIGVTMMDLKGNIYKSGDYNTPFTIQSISKVMSLMLAIMDNGEEEVFKKVGFKPTDDSFNTLYKLDFPHIDKPANPMINSGAIMTTSLIKGSNGEKFNRLLALIRTITENPKINYNEEVYLSEKATGSKNKAIAYLMNSRGFLNGDIEDVLDSYFKQCSIEVDTLDIAKIGLFLANRGIIPGREERICHVKTTSTITAIMATCGMYDFSGEYATKVGIPSKSGVAGGVLGTIPGKIGIGVYSPALDEYGNSIVGYNIMKDLSNKLNLNIY